MDFKEIIPLRALRKFDVMCLHNEYLHENKELRQQILSWAADMLKEARAEWSERRNVTIESIIECHMRSEAKRKSDIKDQKYVPFREYLKKVQREQFDIALQNEFSLDENIALAKWLQTYGKQFCRVVFSK